MVALIVFDLGGATGSGGRGTVCVGVKKIFGSFLSSASDIKKV